MAVIERTTSPSSSTPIPEAAIQPQGLRITLEQALFIGLFVIALLLRLWGLGDRAMHHDETHHANFSWQLYQGNGYVHDPLLHGPFLYHLGAFFFFLFGDSNATARLGTALFGSILVVLPYLIRREIGRTAALLAAAYLVFSPVVLYVNRFIRHDSYTVVFELLTLIAIVRYASTQRPLWLYVAAAALALMLTNMATFYLYVAIFAPLLVAVFLWRVWKPGLVVAATIGAILVLSVFWLPGKPASETTITVESRVFLYYLAACIALALASPWIIAKIKERRFSLPFLGVTTIVIALIVYAIIPHQPVSKFGGTVARASGGYICPSQNQLFPPPNPINHNPGPLFGFEPLPTADNAYALCVRNQFDSNFSVYFAKLWQFFGHPAILLGAVLCLTLFAALIWAIWYRRNAEQTTVWEQATATNDGYLTAFASLGQHRHIWWALGFGFVLYTLLFTAFFTNPTGVVSGAAGSLLYWLAQHDVRRGGQPDYFYLVTLSIYEPLLIFWGVAGLVLVGRRIAWRFGSTYEPPHTPGIDWRIAMPILLAWWAVGTFAIYSWAGEKMPWLTIRSTVPLILLSAWACSIAINWWLTRIQNNQHRNQLYPDTDPLFPEKPVKFFDRHLLIFLGCFGSITIISFIILTFIARPEYGQIAIAPLVPLFFLALLALLMSGAWLVRGWRWMFGAVLVSVTCFWAIGAVRTSYQLNYRWGDTPREMMIYTQTSPDVQRVVDRLAEAAVRRGGANDLVVIYDSETVWSWYMRRFEGAQQVSNDLSSPVGPEVQAALLMYENYLSPGAREKLEGFRIQRLPLRWWFPEDQTYRLPADWLTAPITERSPLLMRALRQPAEPQTFVEVWKFLTYRQLPSPIGSSDFIVAVRPELADELGPGFGAEK
jgi:4-amino-4-deoxy-L-arabinose transferase-like glycosyltransferase